MCKASPLTFLKRGGIISVCGVRVDDNGGWFLFYWELMLL